MNTEGQREFGHLIVERSGGIGGFQLVWDLDIDHSEHREEIGPRVAQLPWSSAEESRNAPSAADRYVFAIESRFGQARFGEGELSGEWKEIVDEVREITDPERRRPG